jgi:energy-coupling factor transporter ATP-binding protein EcfA2
MIPFNQPAPPFLYQDFQSAASAVGDALALQHSYMLLLGESGCGKTTLLRHLQQHLDKHSYSVLHLCHGQPSPSGLARVLADAVHLPIRRTRAETSRLPVSTLKNLPTRLLFWIDEAQLIRDDTLHELRLLSEADLKGPPLFSVILSALPSLPVTTAVYNPLPATTITYKPARTRYLNRKPICRSLDGARSLDRAQSCVTCQDARTCTPRIALDFHYRAVPFRLLLAFTSAKNFVLFMKKLGAAGKTYEGALVNITIIDRGRWGEACFEAA